MGEMTRGERESGRNDSGANGKVGETTRFPFFSLWRNRILEQFYWNVFLVTHNFNRSSSSFLSLFYEIKLKITVQKISYLSIYLRNLWSCLVCYNQCWNFTTSKKIKWQLMCWHKVNTVPEWMSWDDLFCINRRASNILPRIIFRKRPKRHEQTMQTDPDQTAHWDR